MANAVITGASASLGSSGMGSIMTILANEFIGVKRIRGRILRRCNTNASGLGAPHGTARFLVAPSGATVNDDVDGTAPDYDDSIAPYIDVVLDQHKSVKFGFSEIAQTLDGGRSIAPVTAGRMADLFNAIESDVAALGSTFTQSVGTANTDLDESVYDAGRAKLVDAMVPAGDPLFGFYHQGATAWQAISKLDSFREYRIRGEKSNVLEVAEYGVMPVDWKSAYHVESQAVKTATVSSVVNTYNLLFHKDAILVAMKPIMIPTSPGVEAMNFMDPESGIEFQILRFWDKDTDSDALKIHCLYGKSKGIDAWGCVLKS